MSVAEAARRVSARRLATELRAFAVPSLGKSLRELAITAGAFAALWLATLAALEIGFAFALLLAVPAAFFLVRLFVLQHDCGHRSFFRSRRANDWVGHVLGVFTLTPYDYWRRAHAAHHAGSGNLDRRGLGDITTLTVAEYRAAPWRRRLAYRLYRHPLVLFGVGPAYLFLIKHRLPLDAPLRRDRMWLSLLATNLGIGALLAGLGWLVGPAALAMVHLPIVLLAATIGVWMFVVQHHFGGTLWRRDAEWNFGEAALYGSSYYQLPGVLRWLTAGIGLHHVHHLCSAVPSYRLAECLRRIPELNDISRVTLRDSFRNLRLALWDEAKGHMVPFSALRQQPAPTEG